MNAPFHRLFECEMCMHSNLEYYYYYYCVRWKLDELKSSMYEREQSIKLIPNYLISLSLYLSLVRSISQSIQFININRLVKHAIKRWNIDNLTMFGFGPRIHCAYDLGWMKWNDGKVCECRVLSVECGYVMLCLCPKRN